ncbi:hypothetical protein AcV7_003367 [Taiwanofungus camphoratus]|nr:hypothetical protein AcV7_003367 [Antrodia cinnamomea]
MSISSGLVSWTDYLSLVVIVTRICSVISDMIVLVVTWYHTYTVYKSAKAANMKTSLGAIILRDGTFYFITLLLLNVIQMIIEILLYNSKQNIGASYIIYFVPPIASIFISHFIINLRQFQYGSSEATQVEQSSHWQTSQDQAASLHFTARIVDNMGAPLYHFTTTDRDEEAESAPHILEDGYREDEETL